MSAGICCLLRGARMFSGPGVSDNVNSFHQLRTHSMSHDFSHTDNSDMPIVSTLSSDTMPSQSLTNTPTGANQTTFLYSLTPRNSQSCFVTKLMQFEISLRDTDISSAQISTIRFNRSKGTAIISTLSPIKNLDAPDIDECDLKVGTWDLQLKKLRPRPPSIGVIGPIDNDENLPEMKALLLSKNVPLTSIQRLYKRKGKDLVPTQYIKIDFSTSNRPTEIKIGFMNFPVSDYKPNPLQCFKCQRFGHTSTACRSKERCLFCGENHAFKDCNKESKKCANCGSTDHIANYGGCKSMKNAKAIEHLAQKESLTYMEAKDRLFPSHTQSSGAVNATFHGQVNGSVHSNQSNDNTQSPPGSSQTGNTNAHSYAAALQTKGATCPQAQPQSVFSSTPLLMSLILKLLSKMYTEDDMQTILIDAIMSCNQQNGTQFADNDLHLLMKLASKQSLMSFSETAMDDMTDTEAEEFPLLNEETGITTSQKSNKKLQRKHRLSASPPQTRKKKP